MKIGLFGYGKMGRMIEAIAVKRGHEIIARIDGPEEAVPLDKMEVAIDFSSPGAAFGNIAQCLENGVPVISGTTGWLDQFDRACALCREKGGAFIYASNFSLGVNLFFKLNSTLARLMAGVPGYRASLEETHHIHKLDAPSGTAISLAEDIIRKSAYTAWQALDGAGTDGKSGSGELPVRSFRTGEVPGTHRVCWESGVDQIEIIHTAHNREGFALGAVIAAEWLAGKTGVFTMEDVLNLR